MAFAINTLIDTIVNGFIMVVGSLLVFALLGVSIWIYTKSKKYKQFVCIIWTKDAFGNPIEKRDNAGIFTDKKTGNKRFYLKKNQVGLKPDSIPVVYSGRLKLVYLFQTGLKNFRFIRPTFDTEGLSLDVDEEDVNWALNTYENYKRRFNFDKIMQYLPFVLLAFVSIIILLIFIFLFKKLDVLAGVADSARLAAEALANAQTGTVVLS